MEQVANPEAYAAALALADVGPSGSGETIFHTAMHADRDDLPSTANASSSQSGPWNSEDFKSGEPKTDCSDVLSHSPTSTLQARLTNTPLALPCFMDLASHCPAHMASMHALGHPHELGCQAVCNTYKLTTKMDLY